MKKRASFPSFITLLARLGALLSMMAISNAAYAQQVEMKIGLAAPLTGNYAPLGNQMRQGVEAALMAMNIPLSAYQPADTQCDAETAKGIATILKAQNVTVVIGFACSEALETALEVLGPAGIPIITPASRNTIIAERAAKQGWPLFRLTPSATAEREAVGPVLLDLIAPTLFAIIDDGTIYARELAEAFRFFMEEKQLKPVFIDTFRPQMDNQIGLVGRLRNAGATHVFAAGDYDDIAIIARDAAVLDYDVQLIGGEALRAAPITEITMPDNVIMVAPLKWAKMDAAAATMESLQATSIVPEGYVLPAFAAAQIAAQSHNDDLPVLSNLKTGAFDTALGTIIFNDQGAVAFDNFALHVSRNGTFEPVETP